ncbi:MAG: winged helix-turn-helix transcriptional regulator [Desulfobacterales bacterium]
MDPVDIRTLHLLEEIEKNHSPSQRQLARHLDISLGLVNSFIKRLAHKGYFKVTHIPKNRVRYILTPKGAAEKSRLTYEYIKLSYVFFKDARKKMQKLLKDLESQGVKRVIFFGATELAEIAYLSLQYTNIELAAVLDDLNVGKRFFDHMVQATGLLESAIFDRILLTTSEFQDLIPDRLKKFGIAEDRVVMLQ